MGERGMEENIRERGEGNKEEVVFLSVFCYCCGLL
jgi:hypothetical protein